MANYKPRLFRAFELRGGHAVKFACQADRIFAAIPLNPNDLITVGDSQKAYQAYEVWFKGDQMPVVLLLDLDQLAKAAPWLLRMTITVDDLGDMLIDQKARTWQKNCRKEGFSLVRIAVPRKRQTFPVVGTVDDHHPHQDPEVVRRAHRASQNGRVIPTEQLA